MAPQRVIGLVFIALGAMLTAVITTDIGAEAIVAMLGVGFLIAYFGTRAYGLLIPGGILTGLGAGILANSLGVAGGAVVLGLGVGFLLIAAIDPVLGGGRYGWWWPLIPGGILVTVGGGDLAGADQIIQFVLPAVFVVVGLLMLFSREHKSSS